MAHHHHGHSHEVDISSGNKAFIIGICLNVSFIIAEVIAGVVYNSMALLSDAGHNLSDVVTLALSLAALIFARKKSSASFTYGYKKTTVLAALANSVLLLVAVGVLGVESVLRLIRPEKTQGTVIAWVATLGIVINAVSAFLFFRQRKKNLNVKSAYLHMLSDALILFGVLIAGVIMSYTNWYWLDPVVGLAIMIIILFGTWGLLRDSFRMTIDAVPAGIKLEEIKQIIFNIAHVQRVEHVHVWAMSTTENALTAHVMIDNTLSFDEKLKIVEKIKHELQHNDIHHSTIELTN